ncbi:MAG: efflux RND transporter permease subunit [Nitrospinota bacterium]|nr:efflux RND transporter permease subunit [Nitrospinota bacterium]MDH5678440.1 efflux RND transporter permease subunit [Nitrospinota bacterium]MDH5756906.1 efflux RND transporter permease subunit [Nitrospinota bacterium]
MNLPEISIRRHVLALMLNAVLILFGVISFQRIGVDRFPSVDFPVITVTTVMMGANPDIIDSSITNIIETTVNTVPGIEHIRSVSSPGVSSVVTTFSLDKDINVAFNEVQSKVSQAIRKLPEDADPPMVGKMEMGAQPIIWLALRGDRTQQQLNQYARQVVKKRLETINGVGEVLIGGGRSRVIRVELDLDRMASFRVTAQDIIRAFGVEHFQFPGGFLVSAWTEKMIKLDMEYHDPADLAEMILTYSDQAPVKLGDIAVIIDGLADNRQVARFNQTPSVGLGIVKVANANAVAVGDEVMNRVDNEIRPALPPGMTITVATDTTSYIREMIKALNEHLILGTLLASLVVWLFLKSFRSTVIIAFAIPVSLLGAVAVMFFMGYTFNVLTLLALLLLIGVVVDDAIVVLENIYRHREKIDPDPHSAAVNGSAQVVFAVMASTLTLVSIFAPVAFLGGIIGQFFKAFAVVVTFGVMVSLFVSLTLTPMLCSRYLQVAEKHNRIYYALESVFLAMEGLYRRLLGMALHHRWLVVALTILVVLPSGFFFSRIGKGFVPDEDEGRFNIIFKTPLGSNVEYTDGKLKKIEAILRSHKEVDKFFCGIGLGQGQGQVNQGMAFVNLTPRWDRDRTQSQVMAALNKELTQLPGVQAFAVKMPIVGGMRGDPLQFALKGQNINLVARTSDKLMEELAVKSGLGRMDLDLQLDLPQMELKVDRTRAASLGFNARDVALAVNVLAGGYDVAKFNDEPGDGDRYDIRLKAAEGQLQSDEDLKRIYLRSMDGRLVRMDTIARFNQKLGPAVISKYDLQYAAFFFGSPSVPLADAIDMVKESAAKVMPMGVSLAMMGQAEEFQKTAKYMIFTFILATVLVYMVLASQFNSFLQPLIIMTAQPLAMIGGIGALYITGLELNIFSMIGVVLLVGLVAKNSILLIDLTNQFRQEGMEIDKALMDACPIRLRPVLMTSLTVILVLLPAAFGLGAGAEVNGPLSVVVIGGMITSTLLTLVVVPSVYSLVENGVLRLGSRKAVKDIK